MAEKGLISKIYKQFIYVNIKKKKNLTKNWAEYLNGIFPKKTYRWPTGT